GLDYAPFAAQWEALPDPVSPGWLEGHIHSGAVASGEYTLNYAKTIAAEVKAAYRKRSLGIVEHIAEAYKAAMEATVEQLKHRHDTLAAELKAAERLQQLESEAAAYRQSLLQELNAAGEQADG